MPFRSPAPPPSPSPYSGPPGRPPVPSWAVRGEPPAPSPAPVPSPPSPGHRARASHRRRRGARVPDRYERVFSSVTTAAAAVAVLTLAGEVRPASPPAGGTDPAVCDTAPRYGTAADRPAPPHRPPVHGRDSPPPSAR